MASKEILQGDSYQTLRPLYTLSFLDSGGQPLNLSGYTIRTTFKTEPSDPVADPNDNSAHIKHYMRLDMGGGVIASSGLFLRGAASGGVVDQHLTDEESAILPVDVPLFSDVELTTPLGEKISWVYEETLIVRAAYTNRTGDE